MSKIAIFDGNNLVLRCLHGNPDIVSGSDVDYNLWKFTIFSSIFWTLNTREFSNINKVVIAWDKSSWRYSIYNLYKKNRKDKREKDELNWEHVFANLNMFIEEFSQFLPYKNIRVHLAEADDIIGVLVNEYQNDTFIIVSQDCDYLQLYDSNRVFIYAPLKKEFKTCSNTKFYLDEMCLCGQKKDNVYNIITPLDYPDGLKKPSFGPKMAEKIILNGIDNWLDNIGPSEIALKSKKYEKEHNIKLNVNLRERYKLNRLLLDLRIIPDALKKNIIEEYKKDYLPNTDLLYNYFLNNGWRGCLDNFDNYHKKFLQFY